MKPRELYLLIIQYGGLVTWLNKIEFIILTVTTVPIPRDKNTSMIIIIILADSLSRQ